MCACAAAWAHHLDAPVGLLLGTMRTPCARSCVPVTSARRSCHTAVHEGTCTPAWTQQVYVGRGCPSIPPPLHTTSHGTLAVVWAQSARISDPHKPPTLTMRSKPLAPRRPHLRGVPWQPGRALCTGPKCLPSPGCFIGPQQHAQQPSYCTRHKCGVTAVWLARFRAQAQGGDVLSKGEAGWRCWPGAGHLRDAASLHPPTLKTLKTCEGGFDRTPCSELHTRSLESGALSRRVRFAGGRAKPAARRWLALFPKAHARVSGCT